MTEVAARQLTGSAMDRLACPGVVGIKRLVQTKKTAPICGTVLQAVAIPITRPSAPDLDLMVEYYTKGPRCGVGQESLKTAVKQRKQRVIRNGNTACGG